jgi:uncharacterized membrane protein YeaQ/YmgE (transglycosylase-associated protein family)
MLSAVVTRPPQTFGEIAMVGFVLFVLFGLVVGFIARALMPGQQSIGLILTAILGIAGSLLGGYVGGMLGGGGGEALEPADPYNWIGAILGSLVILFIYGKVAGRKTSV